MNTYKIFVLACINLLCFQDNYSSNNNLNRSKEPSLNRQDSQGSVVTNNSFRISQTMSLVEFSHTPTISVANEIAKRAQQNTESPYNSLDARTPEQRNANINNALNKLTEEKKEAEKQAQSQKDGMPETYSSIFGIIE